MNTINRTKWQRLALGPDPSRRLGILVVTFWLTNLLIFLSACMPVTPQVSPNPVITPTSEPAKPTAAPTALVTRSPQTNSLSIVAEISFTYDPTVDSPSGPNPLTVGPLPTPANPLRTVSKRIIYPLEQGSASDVGNGSSLLQKIMTETMKTTPLLVAVDQTEDTDPNHIPGSYYLVAVGAQNASWLDRLNYMNVPITVRSDTIGQCNPMPLTQAYGNAVQKAAGTIVVEGTNGYRHVFTLGALHVTQNWEHFQTCYKIDRILFALFPSLDGQKDKLHLILRTTDPQNPAGGERVYETNYYDPPPQWWRAYCFWC